jgi:hypothetical protein
VSGGYLLRRIVDGREQIVELHDRLYTDRLARHLSRAHVYDPHVTVGRLEAHEQLEAAVIDGRARLVHLCVLESGVSLSSS